ncbi:MAG: ACT domain-containing protein [Desulfobacterales bacterium]
MPQLKLEMLDDTFAIHRFSPSHGIPDEVFSEAMFGIVKTDEELSIVCRDSLDISSEQCRRGWSCIKVSGPLDLNAVGVLASISKVLAEARISIFVVSTYDTDYILMPAGKSLEAIAALRTAGFRFF